MLVVDDNSPDGTGQLADELAAADSRVHVLHRAGEGGPGEGLPGRLPLGARAGLRLHLRDGRRLQPRSQVPAAAPGARPRTPIWSSGRATAPGVNVINWPISRLLLSIGANEYARWITGLPLTDSTGGFKCFRRRGARGDRLREGPLQRLLLPDRDELPGLEEGIPPGGDPDRVHRPGGRAEQDEQAHRAGGDLDGLVAPAPVRWRDACEGHGRLQDDRLGQRLRRARRPRHRARPLAGDPRRGALRPPDGRRGRRPGHPDARRARAGSRWPSGTRTAPGRPCAATRRSAARGSRSTSRWPRRATSASSPTPGWSGPARDGAGRGRRDQPAGLRAAQGQVPGLEPGPGERWLAFATVGVPHLVVRVDDIERSIVLGRGGRSGSTPGSGRPAPT